MGLVSRYSRKEGRGEAGRKKKWEEISRICGGDSLVRDYMRVVDGTKIVFPCIFLFEIEDRFLSPSSPLFYISI